MKNLMKCELQRQFSKKSVTIFFISFLVFIVLCLFNLTFGVGFYDPLVVTPLDGLNFAPFILRDFHLYLIFILCPLIVVQSFNAEYKTGAYRMVMIRPHSKLKLYIAKFIGCVIPLLIFLALAYLTATLIGYLILPTPSTTLFFYEEFTFN
ncbi:MAG: ABC transporter permease, partial [Turicibacter sp.]